MKINNLSEHNCIINSYLAEMRDCEYQKNRLLLPQQHQENRRV